MSRKFTTFFAALLISTEPCRHRCRSERRRRRTRTAQHGAISRFQARQDRQLPDQVSSRLGHCENQGACALLRPRQRQGGEIRGRHPQEGLRMVGRAQGEPEGEVAGLEPACGDAQAQARTSRLYGGRPDNPLGARAIYLGCSLYRIHGTNEPSSIGKAASSGCIRMLNADVSELYAHVKHGRVCVICRRDHDQGKQPSWPRLRMASTIALKPAMAGFDHMPGPHIGVGQRRLAAEHHRHTGAFSCALHMTPSS